MEKETESLRVNCSALEQQSVHAQVTPGDGILVSKVRKECRQGMYKMSHFNHGAKIINIMKVEA